MAVKRTPCSLRRHVRRDRHLAHVAFEPAHHLPERVDEHRHFFECKREGSRLDDARFERAIVSLRAADGSEREVGHGSPNAMEKVTIPALHQMKRDGRKIVGVVAWDYQIAKIVDRAGVESSRSATRSGSTCGASASPLEVTMDQMVIVRQAVRRGTERALVSVDFPFGPLQEGVDSAVRAAIRLVKEAGADMIKLDGAAAFPEAVGPSTRPASRSSPTSASRHRPRCATALITRAMQQGAKFPPR